VTQVRWGKVTRGGVGNSLFEQFVGGVGKKRERPDRPREKRGNSGTLFMQKGARGVYLEGA